MNKSKVTVRPFPGGGPKEEILAAIKDAFFCGIVQGRFEERSLTCPRAHDNPITQEEEAAEHAKVTTEYEATWPGDLLFAGFFAAPDGIGDLVRDAEHRGWLKKQAKAGAADTSKPAKAGK